MGGKREKPEDIVLKLGEVEVLQGQGKPLADAVRQIGVTVQTYYRWRKEYGGMNRDQLKRLKLLEAENTRLRRAVSDLTLDKMILTKAAGGNYATSVLAPVLYHLILSGEDARRRCASLGLVCTIIKISISCHKVFGYLILRLW